MSTNRGLDKEDVLYIYIYIYIYTHTHIYIYIHTHIYIYIHTHIYIKEYYSAIKKNKTMPLAATWMDLDILIGEGNGNPLQYSCPKNPMDRGA